MRVAVLHGKDLYEFACEQDETVSDLMGKLREVSGIFQRHQKLVLKGKTLSAQATLAEAKVKNGARIMLIASSMPLPTQVSLRVLSVISVMAFLPSHCLHPRTSCSIFLCSPQRLRLVLMSIRDGPPNVIDS